MSVWFVVPAHRRFDLTRMCLRALRWACDELGAHAVVVADDANLQTAVEFNFAPLSRPNLPLGAKWNDGFQHACAQGADYVLPFGSDDWIDPDLVRIMVERHQAVGGSRIVCVRRSAAVRADGRELVELRIPYDGGDGVRLFPRKLLEQVKFRPAADNRSRAIDGSIHDRLRSVGPVRFDYVDRHAFQIVDWKSDRDQLTDYAKLAAAYGTRRHKNPFPVLREHFPGGLVDAAEHLYSEVAA